MRRFNSCLLDINLYSSALPAASGQPPQPSAVYGLLCFYPEALQAELRREQALAAREQSAHGGEKEKAAPFGLAPPSGPDLG